MMNISKKPSNNIYLGLPYHKKFKIVIKVIKRDDLKTLIKIFNSGYTYHDGYEFKLALENGSLNIVKYYVEKLKFNINSFHYNYHTALNLSASHGKLNVFKYLISKGARVKYPVDVLTPVLISVVNYNRNRKEGTEIKKEMIDILLDKGVDINQTYRDKSALLHAVMNIDYDIIEHLIDKGANPFLGFSINVPYSYAKHELDNSESEKVLNILNKFNEDDKQP